MAGSLVQVPTLGAVAGRQGDNGAYTVPNWRRFRFLMGALHIGCRLIVVGSSFFFIQGNAFYHTKLIRALLARAGFCLIRFC